MPAPKKWPEPVVTELKPVHLKLPAPIADGLEQYRQFLSSLPVGNAPPQEQTTDFAVATCVSHLLEHDPRFAAWKAKDSGKIAEVKRPRQKKPDVEELKAAV